MAEATSDTRAGGVLLCQAANVGVAFRASCVVSIRPCGGEEGLPSLRALLGMAPMAGRAVMSVGGEIIAVDSVEIWSESVALLPLPPMLRDSLSGALTGFIQAKDRLWPLYEVAELSRLLQASVGGRS